MLFSLVLVKYCNEFVLITAHDIIGHSKRDYVFSLFELIYEAPEPGGSPLIPTANAESIQCPS